VTFHGTKREAQNEVARLISLSNAGDAIEPSKVTLRDYLPKWVADAEAVAISAKTAERYRQLINRQIIPYLGAITLQKIRAADVVSWHAKLLREGRHDGDPLSARTVGHAHRVLRKALADACRRELLTRNPASLVQPPKFDIEEMKILSAEQVRGVLSGLKGTPIFAPVVLLLSTGMRRGELMALRWGDVDLDGAKLRVERSVEKTKAHGLREKPPKTRHGRRTISLPPMAVDAIRTHRKQQLETRVALGLGKLPDVQPVFGTYDGKLRDPDRITQDWKRYTASRGLPRVTLHALRHSHASALIVAVQDVLTISRRLGHGNPNVTLAV
jgi:integrase